MGKLSIIVWIIAAPVFMGAFVTAAMLTPSLAAQEMFWIPIAAVTGAVFAMPISYLVGLRLANVFKK